MAQTTCYFAGTDGTVTVFRASPTRVYQSATFRPISFSAWAPKAPGAFCVSEVTKAEYERLVALKKSRTSDNSPQASWVHNRELVASEVIGAAQAALTVIHVKSSAGTISDAEVEAYLADLARRDAEEGIE
jgi:hypothetical protein